MRAFLATAAILVLSATSAGAEEAAHSHPAPEKLGSVHFENSCEATVRGSFDHAVALLHSFAYDLAANEFLAVARQDPGCAIAHWGAAMTRFHQLWDAPKADALQFGHDQLLIARQAGAKTARERELIDAAATFFSDADPAHNAVRANEYARAMQSVADHYPRDDETQVFYALALLATAAPTDRSHSNQKRAASLLEPVYQRQPDHPGAAHYLIHAYDSTELAARGLPAARAYAKIAPAAPHALHMPSHIFTRLGLWDDSIDSNIAARRVAREQGDVGEELHAMDYLTYAYLQRGREGEAEHVVEQLRAQGPVLSRDFKVSYAATAMPVRLAIERGRWSDAISIEPIPNAPAHVNAIVYWAHALGHTRSGHPEAARADLDQIDACERQTTSQGNVYWAAQVGILSKEGRAWSGYATGRYEEAVAQLRAAADAEDALEKLPVTPGPIVPAREQLGQLLLELHRPKEALQALTEALEYAPGRRAALIAAARAAREAGDSAAAAEFSGQLER
jgi:tetratricopeptide (TPR) repeat protein